MSAELGATGARNANSRGVRLEGKNATGGGNRLMDVAVAPRVSPVTRPVAVK